MEKNNFFQKNKKFDNNQNSSSISSLLQIMNDLETNTEGYFYL